MKDHNKEIRNLTESANRLYEQGGQIGSDNPPEDYLGGADITSNWLSDFLDSYGKLPSGPANQTRGLYRGDMIIPPDIADVTQRFVFLWDQWIAGGCVGPPPSPQFKRMFLNQNTHDWWGNSDSPPSNPEGRDHEYGHGGAHYWASFFIWFLAKPGGDALSPMEQYIEIVGPPQSPTMFYYIMNQIWLAVNMGDTDGSCFNECMSVWFRRFAHGLDQHGEPVADWMRPYHEWFVNIGFWN